MCEIDDPCKHCGRINHHTLTCKDTDHSDSTSPEEKSDKKSDSDDQDERGAESNVNESQSFREIVLYSTHETREMESKKKCVVFFDGGSNVSYITHKGAKLFDAKKIQYYSLEVRTTGGVKTSYNTCLYELNRKKLLLSKHMSWKIYVVN